VRAAAMCGTVIGRRSSALCAGLNTSSLMLTGRRAHPLTECLADAEGETAETDT